MASWTSRLSLQALVDRTSRISGAVELLFLTGVSMVLLLVAVLVYKSKEDASRENSQQEATNLAVSKNEDDSTRRIESCSSSKWQRQRALRKQDFLQRINSNDTEREGPYGYAQSPDGFIDSWRKQEFPQLVPPLVDESPNKNTTECERKESEPPLPEPVVYLDYAGAALPSQSQLQALYEFSRSTLLGNPHSIGGLASSNASLCIEQAKKRILDHFDAHPGRLAQLVNNSSITSPDPMGIAEEHERHPGYEVVFTSGTTDALRIVAERFPFSVRSSLWYPQNSHTSVVGMRCPVVAKGGTFVCKPMEALLKELQSMTTDPTLSSCNTGNLLAVLPLECNFGGDRPALLPVIRHLEACSRQGGPHYCTMLDIAKAAATGPVSLKDLNPDFACVSFYKLFGEPTGLGCLFVKRSKTHLLAPSPMAEPELTKNNHDEADNSYFGGGSVDVLLPAADFVVRRSEPSPLAALCHGTVHFRGIAALEAGFDELERRGGMNTVHEHATCLAAELVRRFHSLSHCNGAPVIEIYGGWKTFSEPISKKETSLPGPTVAFNVRREDGSFVGYNEVSKLASLNRPPIQLRTGCFCNPGACQLALGLSSDRILRNYRESGHVCGDDVDIIAGQPTGAVRASFGKDSLWEDLDELVSFLERIFVKQKLGACGPSARQRPAVPEVVVLAEMYIFPIKSCAAQRVKRWKLNCSSGKLTYDRDFALVDSSGHAMRLQSCPKLTLIQPVIDLDEQKMTISAPGCHDLEVSLVADENVARQDGVIKVCGNRCGGVLWGGHRAAEWFSNFLGVQCWLARYDAVVPTLSVASGKADVARDRSVAFANEQPVLLVSQQAVDELNEILRSQGQARVSSRHFRPNFVTLVPNAPNISGSGHMEDKWKSLTLQSNGFRFNVVGPCPRCSMVDFDPTSGLKGKTLRALAEYRRSNGQITFGIFLRGIDYKSEKHIWLHEGEPLLCEVHNDVP